MLYIKNYNNYIQKNRAMVKMSVDYSNLLYFDENYKLYRLANMTILLPHNFRSTCHSNSNLTFVYLYHYIHGCHLKVVTLVLKVLGRTS